MRTLSQRWSWVWTYLGCVAIFVAISVITHHVALGVIGVNLGLSGFMAIAAFGQMFAITGGGGGIDLSVPGVMTVSAMAAMAFSNGTNHGALVGIIVAIAVSVIIGAFNGGVITIFGIPPIVTTLSVGFILQSVEQIYYGAAESGGPAPVLHSWVRGTLFGVPDMLWLTVILAVVVGYVLQSTMYGRSLEASGQSENAARMAGTSVRITRFWSFVISGGFAGVTGAALATYAGGAFLSMGSSYQLGSIATVVLGGSLIAGGKSTTIGTLGGAFLLTLLVTLMELTNLPIGGQDAVEGLVLIGILAMASNRAAV